MESSQNPPIPIDQQSLVALNALSPELLARLETCCLVVIDRSVELNDDVPGCVRVEVDIARRYGDRLELWRIDAVGEVDVMIDELPPLPQEVAGPVPVL